MEVVQGETYRLEKKGPFCSNTQKGSLENHRYIFVGKVSLSVGERNIFYSEENHDYVMFGTGNVEMYAFACEESEKITLIQEIKNRFEKLEKIIVKNEN